MSAEGNSLQDGSGRCSTAETVAFAAAHATWRALNAQPTRNLTVHGVELSA